LTHGYHHDGKKTPLKTQEQKLRHNSPKSREFIHQAVARAFLVAPLFLFFSPKILLHILDFPLVGCNLTV
jgi:hypothetical protein